MGLDWMDCEVQDPLVSIHPMLGLQACSTTPGLYCVSAGNLNTGPHAPTASPLQMSRHLH